MNSHTNSRGSALRILVGAVAALSILAGIVVATGGEKKAPAKATPAAQQPAATAGEPTAQARQAAYETATATSASLADYPATPQALVADFWNAASRKDYARLVLLCPGANIADFQRHYDKWTPSAALSISEGKPHPKIPGVTMHDVKVNFPGVPNKTIRMAVIGLPDGRPAVDGTNTIWW